LLELQALGTQAFLHRIGSQASQRSAALDSEFVEESELTLGGSEDLQAQGREEGSFLAGLDSGDSSLGSIARTGRASVSDQETPPQCGSEGSGLGPGNPG
jgi:hypothetical protein